MAEFPNGLPGLPGGAPQFPNLETYNPARIQMEPNLVLGARQTQSNPVLAPKTVKLRSKTGYNIINYDDDSIKLGYESSMDEFIGSMFRAQTAFLAQIKKCATLDTMPVLMLPHNTNILDKQCTISYEEIGVEETYDICSTCNNVFKSQYLTRWIKKSCTCPICRTPITKRCQSIMQ